MPLELSEDQYFKVLEIQCSACVWWLHADLVVWLAVPSLTCWVPMSSNSEMNAFDLLATRPSPQWTFMISRTDASWREPSSWSVLTLTNESNDDQFLFQETLLRGFCSISFETKTKNFPRELSPMFSPSDTEADDCFDGTDPGKAFCESHQQRLPWKDSPQSLFQIKRKNEF